MLGPLSTPPNHADPILIRPGSLQGWGKQDWQQITQLFTERNIPHRKLETYEEEEEEFKGVLR